MKINMLRNSVVSNDKAGTGPLLPRHTQYTYMYKESHHVIVLRMPKLPFVKPRDVLYNMKTPPTGVESP